MKTLYEKKRAFFEEAHKNGISWEQTELLWSQAIILGLQGDGEPTGLVDGVALVGVERQGGQIGAVTVKEGDDEALLIRPRLGGPRPVTDLSEVFAAIENGSTRDGESGMTRKRVANIVAELQDAGFRFYING